MVPPSLRKTVDPGQRSARERGPQEQALTERIIPPQSKDRNGELLPIEVLTVALPMACQRRVEAHIREPSTADEPLPDGPAEQRALVGEAEAGEIRIRPQLTARGLLGVVYDPGIRRAATVPGGGKGAGAHRITGRDIKHYPAFPRPG